MESITIEVCIRNVHSLEEAMAKAIEEGHAREYGFSRLLTGVVFKQLEATIFPRGESTLTYVFEATLSPPRG